MKKLLQMLRDNASTERKPLNLIRGEDGAVLIDATRPGHPVLYANPAFERMTGYSAAELAGHLRPPMKCGWRDDDLIAVDD